LVDRNRKCDNSWRYLYRAIDRDGDTTPVLLTARRHGAAALCFRQEAIDWRGEPEAIAIDKSHANTATIDSYNADHAGGIETRPYT
jgi:putative transposase